MNIAQSLVRGSDNLNKMGSEIERVITMVCGLVNNKDIDKYLLDSGQANGSGLFKSPECDWVLNAQFGSNQELSGVSCYLAEGSGAKRVLFVDFSQPSRTVPCHLDKIQDVYEQLPVFVEGMLKTFPYLVKHLEPFFKASKVNI